MRVFTSVCSLSLCPDSHLPACTPPQVQLTDFHLVSPNRACFKASTARPNSTTAANATAGGAPAALLVVLESGDVAGEFSDNLLTLEPCGRPVMLCFSNLDAEAADALGRGRGVDGMRGLDVEALRGAVTATALNAEGGLWWRSRDAPTASEP